MGPPRFEDVYDDHVWDVFGFFAYRLRSRSDAEDLTQATFERALRAWGRYDPVRGSARTWLLAIARNLLIDHHRRVVARPEEIPDSGGIRERAAGSAPPREDSIGISPELERALRTLSAREAEVIALRFGGDLSGPQIADLLGLSLANVQQIVSRALRQLRDELGASGTLSVRLAARSTARPGR